jgi:diguanylate cyclase (GGDEF)-like protein
MTREMAPGVLVLLLLAALAVSGLALVVYRRRSAVAATVQRRTLHHAFTRVLESARTESEALSVLDGYLRRDVPGTRFVFEAADDGRESDCAALRHGEPHRESDPATLRRCEVCREGGIAFCVPAIARGVTLGVLRVSGRTPTPDERERIAAAVRFAAPTLAGIRNLARVEANALADPLTALPNRRATSDQLSRMVAEATRSETTLSLLVVDLDHFAHVNDEHGISVGDSTLVAVSRALRGATRASDYVGRIGGEEFALLLHDTDSLGAAVVAANVLQAVRDLRVDSRDGPLTASVGIATYPQDAPDGRELFNAADHALSLAKDDGRDRAVAF